MPIIFEPRVQLQSLWRLHNHLYEITGEINNDSNRIDKEREELLIQLYQDIDEELYQSDTFDVAKDDALSRQEIYDRLNSLYRSLDSLSHSEILDEIESIKDNTLI